MERAIRKIKDATPEIAELLSREHGKALWDSKGEIAVSLMWMEFACQNVKEVTEPQVKEHDNGRTLITYDPIGAKPICAPCCQPGGGDHCFRIPAGGP
ncbi:Aldehyde dehydrogenase family [Mycobacteroides abscessus subsp. abscessus]|nr:Aldehyde dehydrogenase family [Mycobacteroides abscessus subsp. abscessus]